MSNTLHALTFAPECGGRNTRKDPMEQSTIWWLLAGTAIGIELLTGTFYLLMIAVGLAAAAIAAHADAPLTAQIVVAAVVVSGLVVGWRRYKMTVPPSTPANANPNVNLDIGATVQVDAWNPDGTASVKYRGAQWDVASNDPALLSPGAHQIVEVVGSRLILRKQ